MRLPSHGSNPQYLYEAIGRKLPEKYIDFSANINPLGPPPELKEKWNEFYEKIMVYPDPQAKNLKTLIAKKENIAEDSLLIGNGGAELIYLIARMLSGKSVLIMQPAFSEYEKACLANKCQVAYHQLKEADFGLNIDLLLPKIEGNDALFLCNPNNPTGIYYPQSMILKLIEECEKHNCFLIIDEAFYDFLPEYDSLLPSIGRFSKLIIIRSLTKMFAIPGIRLGYLAAGSEIISELSKLQPHWSTNVLALLTGELCLRNNGFVKQSLEYIQNERIRLFRFFQEQNFVVTPSSVNFYLLRDTSLKDQYQLFEFLLDKGIIPRHTFNFPGLEGSWLRFAIKKNQENNQLMEVLTEWRHHHH